MVTTTAGLHAPVLLEDTLHGGQAFRWTRLEDGHAGNVDDAAVLLRMAPHGCRITTEPAGREAAVARYLGDHDAYAAALARLEADPVLAPAVQRYAGLRVLRQDPWETLVAFITSSNNNVHRITGSLSGLAAHAGAPLANPWADVHAFPPPDVVARAREPTLRRLGFGYRAPFVRETARRVADGFPLHDLAATDRDAAREALLTLPGVGPKVADCVLVFGLGHLDAFPVDRHVARAVAELYPDAPRRMDALATWARERWGADAALAQQFLFHAQRLRSRARAVSQS